MTILQAKKIVKTKELVLADMTLMGHEQVVFCQDSETGLKAIIAIVHNFSFWSFGLVGD